jgi:hypothetical protein
MADRKPGRPKGTPKTGGRKAGTPNKVTREVRELAQQLVQDPRYRSKLRVRLVTGKAAPAVETMLWHYAYGKPADRHELTGKDGEPLSCTFTIESNGNGDSDDD